MIHLCNLGSMNVVYNATGNSFHEDGSPTEMDISLSFMEDKTLTRNDLYGDETVPNYEKLDYDRSQIGPIGSAADQQLQEAEPDNWALNYIPPGRNDPRVA